MFEMNAQITNEVVLKIQRLSGQPCSRGISKIIDKLLDELEEKRTAQEDGFKKALTEVRKLIEGSL